MRIQNHFSSCILIIDDEPSNVLLLEGLLESRGYTHIRTTTDPRRAESLISSFDPDIILLDLHMPFVDGFEILKQIDARLSANEYLPVLVLTADYSDDTRKRSLAAGAMDFLTKPFDASEVELRVRNLLHSRFLYRAMLNQNAELEQRVKERTRDLEHAEVEVLERLASVTEFRDDETGQHTRRVGDLSAEIAIWMGLSEEFAEMLRLASQLHDIGKAGIPDAVLLKPGRLTPDEFDVIKTHTSIGARILHDPRSPLMKLAQEIAFSHHEHWAGDGYPNGLRGEGIPLSGRIVAVADVYDGLTHVRPYKPKWSVDDAVKEIVTTAGKKFDPKVVEAFVEVLVERGVYRRHGLFRDKTGQLLKF